MRRDAWAPQGVDPPGTDPDHQGGGAGAEPGDLQPARGRKTRAIDSFHIIVASISTIQIASPRVHSLGLDRKVWATHTIDIFVIIVASISPYGAV